MKEQRLGRPWRMGLTMSLVLAALTLTGLIGASVASAGNGKVLILETTVQGGSASREAKAAEEAGQTVQVVSPAEWEAMTTAEFAAYDAVILGDPDCTEGEAPIAAANANAATWNAAIGGNVVVIGTDPDFHSNEGVTGAMELIKHGVAFAVENKHATGAYIDLSCYYAASGAGTPVPMISHLSPFGGFKVFGQFLFSSCPEESHIVATSPALAGLTDEALSNWSCSAHEAFEEWPADFEVLTINKNIGTNYTASDGTVGGPYILSRGATVISNISLTPLTAKNPLGAPHTVTATVQENGNPVVGTTVTFTVVAGPNTGVTGTATTNGSGQATFTYTSKVTGTDVIHATFVDSLGRTETSNTVEKEWVEAVTVTEGPALDGIASAQHYNEATAKLTTKEAGDLLVAFVAADSPYTVGQVSTVSGDGLTWTLVARENKALGGAEVWTARATGALNEAPITAKVTRTTPGSPVGHGYDETVTVAAFKNSPGLGAVGTFSSKKGAATGTITTTQPDSWVWAVGDDWLHSVAPTVPAGQTLWHQATDAVGDTYWIQSTEGLTKEAGTKVTINDTAPTSDPFEMVLVEVL